MLSTNRKVSVPKQASNQIMSNLQMKQRHCAKMQQMAGKMNVRQLAFH